MTSPLLTLPNPGALAMTVRAKAVVFEDERSRVLLDRIRQLAPSDATLLVTGETGTGKEIVARHIHEMSHRARRPFVAVNCGAWSESLVESELFGHEKGAFTGATTAKAGWFESADGGTLFLDEVGDLPLQLQVKLLRVLQEREVVRLGSRQPIPIDVRLIAATNVDLEAAVAARRFREDLFYRLNVATVALLPLRERPGDIQPLARYFLSVHAGRVGVAAPEITREATERLLEHPWPGNIRELENAIHHAFLVCKGHRITPADLRLTALQPKAGSVPPPPSGRAVAEPPIAQLESALLALFEQNRPDLHEHIEEVLMRTAYRYCNRNQLQTARLLGISRNIVRARLIQFGELAGSPRARSGGGADAPESGPISSGPCRGEGVEGEDDEEGRRGGAPRAVRAVRIGCSKFGLLMMLVKLKGSLDRAMAERGVKVAWCEFPGGTQLVEALRASEVDLGLVGEGPPILALSAHAPIVYLAAEPPAPEGEAIIVHKDSPIRSVADLKGKTVALNRGSNVDYLLMRALEEANVRYEDVNLSFIPPSGARAAFESREVDAWAIWNPVLSSVKDATGARVLRDGKGLAMNTAFYVGARGFADENPELVQVFLSEVKAVGHWANEHTAEAAELLASHHGMAKPALCAALQRRKFGMKALDAELVASQQEVADTFLKLRLIPRAIRVAEAQWAPPGGYARSA
ncbi:ATPase AAA [Sorangium cellulosum]|uniref:Putative aliphatic sulfonates-binding protein n=1 Tax=Sorangium cellulosum TaxID=56 RepID=A0A2L0FAX9_SORCE|nr:aliphatic sulfonate ABC transporter substrate-binding protein [Sorangium cellulosum]AUX48714.1 ATPase AAA [Sorangium cellulosum]